MQSNFNLSRDMWLRVLPPAATRVCAGIWLITETTGQPPVGDIDDAAASWIEVIAPGGLDTPYDPRDEEGDAEEVAKYEREWSEWQGYAAALGWPMETYRDVIGSLIELGVIERLTEASQVTWQIADDPPSPEEVLPLSKERLQYESDLRWRMSFRDAERSILDWLEQSWVPGITEAEIKTSIRALAEVLGLDQEDARHGLVILTDWDDVRCSHDIETLPIDQVFHLTVDWELFREIRTPYRPS